MLSLKFMTVITQREFAEQYLEFFNRHGVSGVVANLCNGTASDHTLSALNLEKTEKVMFETMVTEEVVGDVVKGLLGEMNIGAAGNGIALFMPVNTDAHGVIFSMPVDGVVGIRQLENI